VKLLKRVALAFLLLLVAVVAYVAVGLRHPSLEPYREHMAQPASAKGGLRATFLGVSTILLDDGETAILTDGFFTRPGKWATALGRIAPDPQRIEAALKRAGITRLAAVITVHSHYDHAMDAPEVASRTGAELVGSESTANVGRGWGLPEARIRVVRGGERFTWGRFEVTLLRSRHVPGAPAMGEIDQPLHPPARATAYREGGSFSVLVRHGERTLLVQGSAGFEPGALAGHKADVVFLGVGLLGKKDATHRDAYWNEVVRAVGAKRVIAIHWDDFTRPLDEPMVPLPRLLDDFGVTMAFLSDRARAEGVVLALPLPLVAMEP
jgi:L-ascorbate metabolism protein UlaG (beta-lactamase superfamily)